MEHWAVEIDYKVELQIWNYLTNLNFIKTIPCISEIPMAQEAQKELNHVKKLKVKLEVEESME